MNIAKFWKTKRISSCISTIVVVTLSLNNCMNQGLLSSSGLVILVSRFCMCLQNKNGGGAGLSCLRFVHG